jgi:hypothetical protein
VYHAIFRKLEEARQALGGKVYDVLGRLVFDGRSLRDCSSKRFATATSQMCA